MPKLATLGLVLILSSAAGLIPPANTFQTDTIDHSYMALEKVLREHVVGGRVNYSALSRNRNHLDSIVTTFGQITEHEFDSWSHTQQIAYLINAYNVFTLQAIIDNYPIDGGWLSFLRWAPRNSIRQIDGVWTKRRWSAAGTEITLDELEHKRLRVLYAEPRIHFAINCAAISCPPLRSVPYTADRLNRQLIVAARDFLTSPHGLQVDGDTILVSRIFDWFGDDFIENYAHLIDRSGSLQDRAILGVIAKYGPTVASQIARNEKVRLRFLAYDWGLNDLEGP